MTNRYHRQILLPQLGEEGQGHLSASRVSLIGCGALGTVIAEQLVRAGVGFLRICDRDVVELTNLQRQVLFDERDAAESAPKAIVAAQKLKLINSTVEIEPHIVDVHSGNIESLIVGANIVIDGTDNAETRYLLNDAAVKQNIPWVYGGCVGTSGQVMAILPGRTPCLRCVFPNPPAPGELPTCDTAGVLASASAIVASLQVVEAMKILMGDSSAGSELTRVQLWPTRVTTVSTKDARNPECPTCVQRKFEFLSVRPESVAVALCGRNTVQIRPARPANLDLAVVSSKLESVGEVQRQEYFLRCQFRGNNLTLTLFSDARAMIHGTVDTALARSIYAKYVGS